MLSLSLFSFDLLSSTGEKNLSEWVCAVCGLAVLCSSAPKRKSHGMKEVVKRSHLQDHILDGGEENIYYLSLM